MDAFRQYLKSERGRLKDLAEAMDMNSSAISQWKKVPAEYVLDVERLTGLSRHDIRPDVFGPAATKKRARAAA